MRHIVRNHNIQLVSLSLSFRSESLVVGDCILAVNKKKTENLTHQEIVDLLRNAGQHVHLRVQYKVQTPGR